MSAEKVILLLVCYIMGREAWFFYQVNVLVNKLASRGHYEYRLAESIGKKKEEFRAPKVDDEVQEDVDGHLAGFG